MLISSVYFVVLLVFLFPVFLIITLQLIQILVIESQFNRLVQKDLAKDLNTDDAFNLAKIYARKKMWLLSIKTLESRYEIETDVKSEYFNAIGFSYYSIKQYDLAKVYYLKALGCKENYLIALQNLAKVYELTNDFSLAFKTYKSISFYDPGNSLASKRIEKMKSRDSRI